jgi:long-chain acyl-CoA synthetase
MTAPTASSPAFAPPVPPPADRPWLALYGAVPPSLAPYPERPLDAFLRDAAATWAERTALDFYGAATSYAALDAQVERFAAALQGLGVRPGRPGRARCCPNCPQFVVAFYGALRAGATAVGVNPLYTPRELAHVLRDSGAETLVVLAPLLRTFDAVDQPTPVRHVIVAALDEAMPATVAAAYLARARADGTYVEVPAREGLHRMPALLAAAPAHAEPAALDARAAVAALQYTGGTTGTSKGAMLTHHNLVSNCLQTLAWSPHLVRGAETTIAVLPFFHIYGLTVVLNLNVVAGGATLVVLPRFDAAEVLGAVERHRATVLPMVPSMFIGLNAALAAAEARGERVDLSSLKSANAGGAPLPAEVASEFHRRTGSPVHEGYGLSEASPVTHFNPSWLPPTMGSVGVPIPDVESRIVDPDGRPLPPDAVGELCVRGPNVMLGYWNRPDETARVLRDHPGDAGGPWLHTGDLARMSPLGYVTIVDRAKDMLLVGRLQRVSARDRGGAPRAPRRAGGGRVRRARRVPRRGGARRGRAAPRRVRHAGRVGGALRRPARALQGPRGRSRCATRSRSRPSGSCCAACCATRRPARPGRSTPHPLDGAGRATDGGPGLPGPPSSPCYRTPVASASSAATRSVVGGCVLNSFATPPPENASGLTCASGAIAGLTAMGMRCAPDSSVRSARASPSGRPVISAPTRSALNSRCRLMANWMSIAAIGATIAIASAPTGLPSSSSPRRPPNIAPHCSICPTDEIAPAMVAATVMSSMSRFLMCASSWAITPSSSSPPITPSSPSVTHTTACAGLRPVANALGCGCGAIATVGIGSPARWRSRSTMRYSSGASASVTTCAP